MSSSIRAFFSKSSLLMISIPALLFCMGLFITYPLTGLIFVDIICDKDGHGPNDDDCSSKDISQQASTVMFYGTLAGDLPSFFFLGVYSNLADKYGRRIPLMLPAIGQIIYFGGLFIVAGFKPDSYMWVYVISSFLNGCCGGYSTYMMAMFSYLADITQPSERASKYSVLEAMIFICQIVGPLGGGFWAAYVGFMTPMLFAIFCAALTLLWTFCMPESLPADASSRQMTYRYDPLTTLLTLWSFFTIKPAAGGSSAIPYVLISFAFFFWAVLSNSIIFPLFAKHVFHWDSDMVGVALSLQGLYITLSMLGMRKVFGLVTGYQLHPVVWIFIGILGWSIYYLAMSFAFNTPSAMMAILTCFTVGQALPLIRALLANCVPPHMQAKMSMSYGALQAIVTLLSSLATLIYSHSLDWHDEAGLVYWAFSLSCFIGFLFIGRAVFSADVRANLPDMDGHLPRHLMGFDDEGIVDPLLGQQDASTGSRFKDGLRAISANDVCITSVVVPSMDVASDLDNDNDNIDNNDEVGNIERGGEEKASLLQDKTASIASREENGNGSSARRQVSLTRRIVKK